MVDELGSRVRPERRLTTQIFTIFIGGREEYIGA